MAFAHTYSWGLREIMAARGLNNISDLIPLLTERGITLSASQIYRLVGDRPERISLTELGALIDALERTVEDLCAFRVEAAAAPKAVNASPGPEALRGHRLRHSTVSEQGLTADPAHST